MPAHISCMKLFVLVLLYVNKHEAKRSANCTAAAVLFTLIALICS